LAQPDTNTARDPDLSVDPNKYAAENGLSFEDGAAHLRGYQEFTVDPRIRHLRAIGGALVAKDAVVERAFAPRLMAGRSLLDLGGNNGYFAFKALAAGATSAAVVDIDAECILNLQRVRSRFPELRLEAHQENSEGWDRPADVVLAFALVHWIYSCTAHALSLDRVIGALASLTRDMLLVEWVDPADPLVQGYHHTEVAGEDAAEPYDFDAFLRALSARFSRVELLGELSPTRRIYLATRGPLPDLSWSAPLLFPRETLLTSRMLWAAQGVEFWSRVHHVEGAIYRQCSPELARREVAGAGVLGIAVEVLEQHDEWWLLRTAFVTGETLDERVARERPSREELLRLTLQLVDTVGRLKQAGVVHRDLHPTNVIVDAAGDVHLIDFGWADVPGVPEISPSYLGCGIELPATRTTMTVQPPEASGGDLFAVGHIVGWMNGTRDQELDLLAGWLAHPDQRLRLNDVDLARQLVLRMLGSAGSRPRSPEGSDARLDEALLRLAGAALRKAARLGPVQQEHAELQGEHRRLGGELAAAQARGRDLEQSLAAAQARARDLEQSFAAAQAHTKGLEETLYWMKRSRFWKARDLWFVGKRALRISR